MTGGWVSLRQEFSQLLTGWQGEYRVERGWTRLLVEVEILLSNLLESLGETALIKDTRLEDLDLSLGDPSLNTRLCRGGTAG